MPSLGLARDALRERRYVDAERGAHDRTIAAPDDADAWYLLGEARRELWRMAEAQEAYGRAIALRRDHAESHAALGFVQIVRGRVDDGLASCRRATRLRSDLAAPHRHRATALLIRGRSVEAAQSAADARRLDPDAPENQIVLSAAWHRCGLTSGALRLIDRVIRDHSQIAEAYVNRAIIRLGQGQLAPASDDLNRALALKPWLAPAHATLAYLRRIERRNAEALEAIQRARDHHPDSEDFLFQHLDLLEQQGSLTEAIALATESLWRHVSSRLLRMRLAMLLLADGQLHRALRYIPGVLPSSSTAVGWRTLAEAWRAFGREAEYVSCLKHAAILEPSEGEQIAIAESYARLGQLDAGLEAVTSISPETPASALVKAQILEQMQRHDDSWQALAAAAERFPESALVQMRLGMAARQRSSAGPAFAENCLRRAVELAPHESATHEQLAIFLSDQKRFDEAQASLQRASELTPGLLSIRFNRAVLLARMRRWREAEQQLREVLREAPLNVSALGNLARVLGEQQRHEEAAEVFESVIELVPADPGPWQGYSTALRSLRRYDEAILFARRWTDEQPDNPEAWKELAVALATLNDLEAEQAAERVRALRPGTVAAYETSGIVALHLNRLHEAVDWFDRGLALAPNQASLLVNRGLAMEEVEGLDAAAAAFERALALEPGSKAATVNLSMVLLRLGRFAEAWPKYERRDSSLHGPQTLIELKAASGARPDLSSSIVHVRAEQGLGDTIHFMRYLPRLANESREVIFQVQDSLAWMAWGMAPNLRVFGYHDAVPVGEYQVSLLSLPGYYDTDLASIPEQGPYVRADPDATRKWRERIGTHGFKVGIVWHTNPAHGNVRRWVPLSMLAELSEIEGVRVISLQKNFGLDQLDALDSKWRVERLDPGFDEGPDAFFDTAAAVANLDLVIAMDTAIGHLAGAMGRPVWVLLRKSSDWRWLTDREDSPWYPTLRLFRQTVHDDWSSAAPRLRKRLEQVVRGESPVIWPV